MQRMGRRKCRRVVAAGQNCRADRFGKTHAPIPIPCLRETRPIRISGNLACVDGSHSFEHRRARHCRRRCGRETCRIGIETSSVSDDSCKPASRQT